MACNLDSIDPAQVPTLTASAGSEASSADIAQPRELAPREQREAQLRRLASKVGTQASAEDIAEALELVAHVQREAALDADGSGWGTDLDMFLAEVTLTTIVVNRPRCQRLLYGVVAKCTLASCLTDGMSRLRL